MRRHTPKLTNLTKPQVSKTNSIMEKVIPNKTRDRLPSLDTINGGNMGSKLIHKN